MSRRSRQGPSRPWKYHQGSPFTAMTTAVAGPSSGCIAVDRAGHRRGLEGDDDIILLARLGGICRGLGP